MRSRPATRPPLRLLAFVFRPHHLWQFSGSERRFIASAQELIARHGVIVDAIEVAPPLAHGIGHGYTAHALAISPTAPLHWNLLKWIILSTRQALRLASSHRYDLVYASNNNVFNFVPAYITSRLLRLPLVVVTHHLRWCGPDVRSAALNLPRAYRLFRRFGLTIWEVLPRLAASTVEWWLLPRADRHLVVSEAVRALLRQGGIPADRIAVGSGGVAAWHFAGTADASHQQYDAIYVGRLDEGKAPEELVHVWRRVVAQRPTARLAIVGQGLLQGQVEALIRAFELSQNVTLCGYVSDDELWSLYAASRLFLSCSWIEGWGLAVSEAMAHGLPVVAYEIPAFRERLAQCASVQLVPPGAMAQMAEAIERVLASSAEQQRQWATASVRHARQYAWPRVATRDYAVLAAVRCRDCHQRSAKRDLPPQSASRNAPRR